MRTPLVRMGDSTTTRGIVLSGSSDRRDNGRALTLHGDHATCGNCEGSFPIFGSAEDCRSGGRASVRHGDPVMCPCGKNRVIAGPDAGCFVSSERTTAATQTQARSFAGSDAAQHDEQIQAESHSTGTFSGMPYRIETDDGQVEEGTLDENGQLPRIFTDSESSYSVYWGDSAISRRT